MIRARDEFTRFAIASRELITNMRRDAVRFRQRSFPHPRRFTSTAVMAVPKIYRRQLHPGTARHDASRAPYLITTVMKVFCLLRAQISRYTSITIRRPRCLMQYPNRSVVQGVTLLDKMSRVRIKRVNCRYRRVYLRYLLWYAYELR